MFVADAALLVVGPNTPQFPICLFEGSAGWRWRPGTYVLTISAMRQGSSTPLTARISMTLSGDDATFLNENVRALWEVPTTPPAS